METRIKVIKELNNIFYVPQWKSAVLGWAEEGRYYNLDDAKDYLKEKIYVPTIEYIKYP